MTAKNISDILGKINELRAVFVLGQRAIPFLEEIFFFLKDISPILEEVNTSIRDSTSKIPHAASQLKSVTQATELATTEILDLIDVVLSKSGQHKSQLEETAIKLDAISRADTRLIRLLRTHLQGVDEGLLTQIEIIHDEKIHLRRSIRRTLRDEVPVMNEIRENVNRIMIALQVQDITTQQLASVNHLIISMRDRLAKIISRLNSENLDYIEESSNLRFGHFDENAKYDTSGKKQNLADEVVASYKSTAELLSEPSSQNEIDLLFNGDTRSVQSQPASQDDIDQLFGGDASPVINEPASQDDIDQLFGGDFDSAPLNDNDDIIDGPTSQDEIDLLF